MGDNATAAKVYVDMLNSGRVAPAQAAVLLKAEASLAFNAKNYPAAIGWIQRYLKTNPSDGAMRTQLITAYYLNKDFANAGKLQAAQVAATVRAGQRPTEEQLQLLAACQREGGDTLGFGNTMVQLVTYYPKPDYWLNLVHSAQTRPGFSSRLTLDIDRFNMAIGVPAKPDDLMEMTELALQVPLPGEAKAIVDDGYAKGVFGTGPGAPRQQRLRDLVNKTYEGDPGRTRGRGASQPRRQPARISRRGICQLRRLSKGNRADEGRPAEGRSAPPGRYAPASGPGLSERRPEGCRRGHAAHRRRQGRRGGGRALVDPEKRPRLT
jgi:hypothetical protein